MDVHTMVQGFGLTMTGKTLTWFQTLKPDLLYDYETQTQYDAPNIDLQAKIKRICEGTCR